MDRIKDYIAAAVCLAGMPALIMSIIVIYDLLKD
jgi:hypothetical protein